MEWRNKRQKRDGRNGLLMMDEAGLGNGGGAEDRMEGLFGKDRIRSERQEYAGDSTMMVRIQSYEEKIPRGVFISFDYDCKYEFQGFDQMLLAMEDIMDSLSVPRPAYEHRSVYGKEYVFQEVDESRRLTRTGYHPGDIPRLPRGKASFVLRFYYRQYGSMQGEMYASVGGKEKKVSFRSALELTRLLHEYLDTELGC